jgi:glycerol-3-phosphate dehydrogenase (NAD(P)+)
VASPVSEDVTRKVAFIGAGRWAVALGLKLAERGFAVSLWETDGDSLARLLETRRHPDLPPSCAIPDSVRPTGELAEALSGAELAVFAVPSEALADAARRVSQTGLKVPVLATVTKGIDPESLKRMSVVLHEVLPGRPVVVLAGPGIPFDVALGDPTSLVASSEDQPAATLVRDVFSGGTLRVYSHPDVVGVELGAALKNVIAIAAGIADSIGLGINAKAALLTRGLAEMTRLGIAFNANPLTFSGLSGMGDLIVTAFSEHSRNHALGIRIGKGETLAAAQAALGGVAEGASTCRTARRLANRQHVELPIADEVYRILYEGASPRDSIDRLLRRKPKQEVWQ